MKYYLKSKYHSTRCRCRQEHMHDSKGEAGYCNDLALRVKAADLAEYEIQKKFELHGRDGKRVSNHYVDFLLTDFDNKQEVHEYKGFATELWKLKKALFEHEYPEIPYIVIYISDKRTMKTTTINITPEMSKVKSEISEIYSWDECAMEGLRQFKLAKDRALYDKVNKVFNRT